MVSICVWVWSFQKSQIRLKGWAKAFESRLKTWAGSTARKRSRRRWSSGTLEGLEGRALMTAVPGVDYVFEGSKWANPSHVTFSFAPDGVAWGSSTNNLNAVFDAKFGAGVWEKQIIRALATWESVANINFTQVADGAYAENTPGLAQGDSRYGDIRFGGYTFPGDQTTLAQSYAPPTSSVRMYGGQVEINTSMPWQIGNQYDFYSVMLHETGLTLGLGEPSNPAVVMNSVYHGVLTGLAPGDIFGIQALYGPRVQDAYQQAGKGLGLSSAIDVSGSLNASGVASLSGVSLATIGSTEYFSVVAPAGTSGSLNITANAAGVSLLSPKVTLFDASGKVIDTEGDPTAYGDNVTVHASGVTPGQKYYVAVTGATGDVFSVGAYTLNVGFSVKAAETITPPVTVTRPVVTVPVTVTPPTPTPTPVTPTPPVYVAPQAYGTIAQAMPLGVVNQTAVANLSLQTGASHEFFQFQNARAGTYYVFANGANVQVIDAHGNTIASGVNSVGLRVYRAKTTLYVEVSSANGGPLANYGLQIEPASVVAKAAQIAARNQRLAAIALQKAAAKAKLTHAKGAHAAGH